MDGFGTNTNVIVFAATNQKDVLDSALTRPGRFDRLIEVDLPDIEGRKEIFMVHLKPIVTGNDSSKEEYAKRMATLTPGFSGADIKNLCNEAAIMAARSGGSSVTMHDFELATERMIGGVEKRSMMVTPEVRKVVAYHECGHGVASWFLEGANPLLKLTIIPRSKGSMGFAQYLPHESQIYTPQQLEDQLCVILAGRVTEEVFFGKVSTGAYDDLQRVYALSKKIITEYGMSESLGWLKFEETEYAKYYSKQTEQLIDR
jgi:AFG3 family protein